MRDSTKYVYKWKQDLRARLSSRKGEAYYIIQLNLSFKTWELRLRSSLIENQREEKLKESKLHCSLAQLKYKLLVFRCVAKAKHVNMTAYLSTFSLMSPSLEIDFAEAMNSRLSNAKDWKFKMARYRWNFLGLFEASSKRSFSFCPCLGEHENP